MNNGKLLNDKDVKQFIIDVLGEEGLDVVKCLTGREVTDERIAEETGFKLNIVRKMLYKLYDYRLASYVRTKDKEIGWYIYTWKLDLSKISDILKQRKVKMLDELTGRLEFETSNVFFTCRNDNAKVPFTVASENSFKCPHCNEIMDYADNRSVVSSLEREINRIRKEIRH